MVDILKRLRNETPGQRRVRLDQQSLIELMPFSDKPDVVALAHTIYSRIPVSMTEGLPIDSPQSHVQFVENNPEGALKLIEKAREAGIFDE